MTDAQKKAQKKYDKENTKQVVLKLNMKSDADILARLQNEENKQGYIKELIRMNMQNCGDVLSLDSIRYLLLPIVRKYEIRSVSVFGSYARNEARPDSDVDLLIDGGNYIGLVAYMSMIREMERALIRNVDVVTRASLESNQSPADLLFKERIEKEMVVLI